MYELLSTTSYIVRFIICYKTIEAVPIFKSPLLGIIFAQAVPIYSVMLLISYEIVGRVFKYRRGTDLVLGVLLYALVYIPLALLLWGILLILTWAKTLPVQSAI